MGYRFFEEVTIKTKCSPDYNPNYEIIDFTKIKKIDLPQSLIN